MASVLIEVVETLNSTSASCITLGKLLRVVFCCFVIYTPKFSSLKQNILSLTVSKCWEYGSRLVELFWLKVSHEVAVKQLVKVKVSEVFAFRPTHIGYL